MRKLSIYKEWYAVNSETEATAKWRELNAKGYDGSEIYIARYEGKDGKFHREVFVFKEV